MITKKIYLSSQSPRRRQILTQLGLDFDIVLPDKDVDEKLHYKTMYQVLDADSSQIAVIENPEKF